MFNPWKEIRARYTFCPHAILLSTMLSTNNQRSAASGQRSVARSYLVTDRDDTISLTPSPDHLTIEPETPVAAIGIEEIRNLKTWAALKPFQTTFKVVLIRKAQNLTVEAQNAMLKLLEEPPEQTIIVLTVDDAKNLLPTVISRCTQLDSRTAEQLNGLEQEKIIEDTSLSGCQAACPVGEAVLGVKLSGCLADRFAFAEDLAGQGRETVTQTLSDWLKNLHSKLHQEKNPNQIAQVIKEVEVARRAILKNANARLTLENLMLKPN